MFKKLIKVLAILLIVSISFPCLIPNSKISEASSSWKTLNYPEKLDYENPTISLKELSIPKDQIVGVNIDLNNKNIPMGYEIKDDQLNITLLDNLNLNTEYIVKIFLSDGNRYKIKVRTIKEPSFRYKGKKMIIKVPAMPEKGFYWPYFLVLPSNEFEKENENYKKYVMVDTTNSHISTQDYKGSCLNKVKSDLENNCTLSGYMAEHLNTPLLFPAFPRPDAYYYSEKDGFNNIYTHALDRDTAMLHILLKDNTIGEMIKESYKISGYDANTLLKLDEQLAAMIDHGIKLLNKNGVKVEKEKAFLYGYSASGTFTDRFAALHPDKVKAIASGATLDDMILPLAEYKGKNLIFPIGTYDYKEITGKDFDLDAHNSMARLIFMGRDDDNNTLPYNDCYGDREREIIKSLWGKDVLPRAIALRKLYGEAGGKGIFILDKDVKHSVSDDMEKYILDFFRANANSDSPVYPVPKNKNQLDYIIYE